MNTPTKRCSKCQRELPATLEYFKKATHHKDGLTSRCKDCERERLREYMREKHGHKPRPVTRKDGLRHCSTCGQWKPETPEFWSLDKNRKGGFSSVCKECNRVSQAIRKERYKDTNARYRELHREEARRNAQTWRENNRERDRANALRWQKEHPAHKKVLNENRRARLLSAEGRFTQRDWLAALQYWEHKCAICGRPAGLWSKLVPDHWIPLANGGSNDSKNIVPMCHAAKGGEKCCNNLKSDHDPVEWLNALLGKRRAARKLAEIARYFKWVGNRGN